MTDNDIKNQDNFTNKQTNAGKERRLQILSYLLPFAVLICLICIAVIFSSSDISANNTDDTSSALTENLAEADTVSSTYVGNMQFFSDSSMEPTESEGSEQQSTSSVEISEYDDYYTSETDTDTDSEENESDTDTNLSSYVISDFPIIYQMPELPTGCEITALTMILTYYGFDADKVELATEYLPTLYSAETYYGDDGLLYGNDLNQYFIGDPQTESGFVCGTGAIVTAANQYLADCGSEMSAVDLSGTDPEYLYEFVKIDTPVLVWCTIDMTERTVEEGWYTESGSYVDYATNDHGAVLIGCSDTTVTIADPISGLVEYDKERFESVFYSRSERCVILR